MSDKIDPLDIARALEGAKRLERIMGEAPKQEAKPEPQTKGEFAARAIARNRDAQR